MPQFAANLSMMFTEWAFLDRFDAAAEAGFPAVEYLFPYAFAADAIAERLTRNGLTQALFNLPPGNWEAGERGLGCLPGRFGELQAGVAKALDYAQATGVERLHLMSGVGDPSDPATVAAYRKAVLWTAERLAEAGLDLVLEPINNRTMPGYFLNTFPFAENLIKELGMPNLKLQFDVFHRQILHGDMTMALRALMPITGHVQVAGVPSRHEPDGEELNYPFLFEELDRLGYAGFVGCEYNPRAGTLAGLGWYQQYR